MESAPVASIAPRWPARVTTWAALGGVGLLLVLALVRALTLENDHYDAYEHRMIGRALAGLAPWADPPVWRSPLFGAVCGLGERLGPRAGWLAPCLLSWAGYVLLVVGSGGLALRLGAPGWGAALLALLAGLDRLAFLYAPHGLAHVTAAGAATLVMWLACAPGADPWPRHPALLGAAVGGCALARPNVGLVGLALALGGLRLFLGPQGRLTPAPSLPRLLATGGAALGGYLVVSTAVFALARGSLTAGLGSQAELLGYWQASRGEAFRTYSLHAGPLYPLAWTCVSSPALMLLGAPGLLLAARDARPAARACAAWTLLHLTVMSLHGLGSYEARHVLPVLPGLVGLGALTLGWLERAGLARAPRLRTALPPLCLLGLGALCLSLGAGYEARRLSDPAQQASFARSVADQARALSTPGTRFLWTTLFPYGVAPRVVREQGTPYPGDPFDGIFHIGHVVLSYHLEQPVSLPAPDDPGVGPGLRDPAALRAFVRSRPGFRAGDVLLVGEPRPCLTWTLREAPPGPFGVARVVDGPDGLDLEWRWLQPGGAP